MTNTTVPQPVLLVEPPVRAMTPWELGQMDAHDGLLCVPGDYFVRPDQMVEYALGYESVAGPTLLSRQILRRYASEAVEPVHAVTDDEVEMAWLALFARDEARHV